MTPEITPIFTLPPELIENILIFTSLDGYPSSIAAFAKTCRTFHTLICCSSDHHLWREVFLTTFDDPRHYTHIGVLIHSQGQAIDWELEFKERLTAAKYIRQSIYSPSTNSSGTLFATFKSLLSVVATMLPIPQSPLPLTGLTFPPLMSFVPSPIQHHVLIPRCQNVTWLDRVLQYGYPPGPTQKHLGFHLKNNDICQHEDVVLLRKEWEASEEGRMFYELLFCTGFIPIHSPPGPPSYSRSPLTPPSPTVEEQVFLARRRARIKLYDIRYPSRQRHWGPFMPAIVPSPQNLVPDFAFLAAARVVMEGNLKDMLESSLNDNNILKALRSLEGLRTGGAPGFWKTVRMEDANEEPRGGEKKHEQTDEGKEDGELMGYDWAGVTGQWRRVICWLDYRELLNENSILSEYRFEDRELVETTRFVSMTLRISGYSCPEFHGGDSPWRACGNRPLLPIIHVEGESDGGDSPGRRQVRGTVSMIADGCVRWFLTSSEVDSDVPEWVSESIQIGSIGSAIGCIGTWTGVDHGPIDPIGPCWAWKVA